jgi:hypothetical protein
MELIVAPADEYAIADRQNACGRLGELLGPNFVAAFQ